MGKIKRPEMINTARKIGRSDSIKKRCLAFEACRWHGSLTTPIIGTWSLDPRDGRRNMTIRRRPPLTIRVLVTNWIDYVAHLRLEIYSVVVMIVTYYG
jgi:hypothetical protein